MARHLIVFVLAACGLILGTASASSGAPADGTAAGEYGGPRIITDAGGNTGVADSAPADLIVGAVEAQRMAPKVALKDRAVRTARLVRAASEGRTEPGGCTDCLPNSGAQPLRRPLFAEGEGNGRKTYTCGPSATRNMVWGMAGSYDPGEHQYEIWEGTTSDVGTYISAIRDALNNHFSAYGHWAVYHPTSASDLVSTVAADVNAPHKQSSIQNVVTTQLPFWHGTFARHYDLAYSYNIAAQVVGVAEEWGHTVGGGYSAFGFWSIGASVDLAAINASPTQQLIW